MMMARVLHAGSAAGPVIVLDEPLSFWGAYNPRDGKIVDTHHPQSGLCLGGHILLLPETRGSGSAPGGIAEAIRLGTAPLGILMITPDINIAIGAAVAAKLYGRSCPVLSVTATDYDMLKLATHISIANDGQITI